MSEIEQRYSRIKTCQSKIRRFQKYQLEWIIKISLKWLCVDFIRILCTVILCALMGTQMMPWSQQELPQSVTIVNVMKMSVIKRCNIHGSIDTMFYIMF